MDSSQGPEGAQTPPMSPEAAAALLQQEQELNKTRCAAGVDAVLKKYGYALKIVQNIELIPLQVLVPAGDKK